MARSPLPRFRYSITVDVVVAASTEADADGLAEELSDLVVARADSAVRNHRGRTARLVGDTHLDAHGPALEVAR